MTTTTSNFMPNNLVYSITFSDGMIPDPIPVIDVYDNGDGTYTITAPDDITKQQLDDALASQWRNIVITQNMDELFDKIGAAVPANRDFLAISSPTAEQNDTQIQALTRQINALLIMRTGEFTDISGT